MITGLESVGSETKGIQTKVVRMTIVRVRARCIRQMASTLTEFILAQDFLCEIDE